jgi:hypothetical protein
MKVKCIKDHDSVGRLKGLRIDTYYQLTDIDTIGYRIIDDLGRNFWFTKDSFEPIEETRDKLLNKLINNL